MHATSRVHRWGIVATIVFVVTASGCIHPAPVPTEVDTEPKVTEAPIEFANLPYANLTTETTGHYGGDYDVDVSPDGTWIAYSSTRHSEDPNIYTKNLRVGGPVQKTQGPHWDIQPKISPDGKWIAFASNREGNFDIWVIPSGNQAAPRHLTNDPSDEIHPTWSPDGRSVAYSALGVDQVWYLWIIDLDTQKRRQIGPGLYPEWSPDGESLAFQRPSGRKPGWYGIWTIDVNGGAPQEIVVEEDWGTIQPSWAPNSRSLVYGTAKTPLDKPWVTPRAEDLWLVDLSGNRLQLTLHTAEDYAPAWGLNGRIYFTSDRDGSPRIYSIDPSPSEPKQLAPMPRSGGRR